MLRKNRNHFDFIFLREFSKQSKIYRILIVSEVEHHLTQTDENVLYVLNNFNNAKVAQW